MNWVAIVPVKGTRRAKSRLEPLSGRAELATAFALDTIAALQAAEQITAVFVVTGCRHVAARVKELGAIVVMEDAVGGPPGDIPGQPHDRLNFAVGLGLAAAHDRFPEAGLAVFTGDLPALTPADVDAALALADAQERSVIPDADGTGTTALLARAGIELTPRFGVGSRQAHERKGHVVLDIAADSRIRHDVDRADDLDRAVTLGVGPHTSALLAHTAAAAAGSRSTPATAR